MKEKPDVLQGTLALNQGTPYRLLLKLEHEGSIASQWGASENDRRARFFEVKAEDLP